MHVLTTALTYQRVSHIYSDRTKALLAYERLKAALATYKPYGNDKDASVTIDGPVGEITIRLDSLSAVELSHEDTEERNEIYRARIRSQLALAKIEQEIDPEGMLKRK